MLVARFQTLWWFRMSHDGYAAIHDKVLAYLAERGVRGVTMMWDKNGAALLFQDEENLARFKKLSAPPASYFGL